MTGCLISPAKLAAIGVSLIIFAIFAKHCAFPTALHLFIQNYLYLYPGSEVWEVWKEPPVPLKTDIYVFNVTNPEEIRNGAKPKLQEVGNYAYSQWLKKHNVTLNDDNTVTYYESRTFHFEPTLSRGSLDDVVTIFNYPLVEAIRQVSLMGDWRLSAFFLNMVLNQLDQDLFVTKSVRQLLFDGYHEPLLSIGQKFTSKQFLVDDKFAFLSIMNMSMEGPLTVRTGQDNIFTLGQVTAFKGSSSVPLWGNQYCDMINGTDGLIFHPFIARNEHLPIFVKEACRSVHLEFVEDVSFDGIPMYRYTMPDEITANPMENPDNECFCSESSMDQCPPSGLADLFPCMEIHVFTSFPHFYRGDKLLLQLVDGLSPDPEKHQSYLDIQPDLGYPFRGRRRGQVSFELRPFPHLDLFRHIPRAFVPLFWLSEEVQLPEDLLFQVKLRFLAPKMIVEATYWIGLVVGAAMVISGLVVWKASKDTEGFSGFPKSVEETLMCNWHENIANVQVQQRTLQAD